MDSNIILGDSRERLKELEDNSVDSIVCDPPYELGFMNKGWDKSGIAFNTEFWKECLRVLKPGGHLLAFGGTRTYHRMTVAIEDAGFEIRDCLAWMYGSGFPKSHNIGKAVDKLQGNERVVVGSKGSYRDIRGGALDPNLTQDRERLNIMETKGNSQWEGFGTALKPAFEPVVMGRKPFKGTVAENVLEWGTGGLNIDGCRIGNEKILTHHAPKGTFAGGELDRGSSKDYYENEGRWPANVILDEEAGKILDKQSGNIKGGKPMPPFQGKPKNDINFTSGVKEINRIGYDDTGGASRFFYCPKASKKDRGTDNGHPTVKPTDLCAYLIRLVTPKGGTVLDPFMGSGSMGKAAVREGMNYIGIELNEEYYKIAESRISYEKEKHKHREFFQ